ncbi:murein biosynthesis integral membrane protein MurJ [Cellulosimicrobium arenosum]|uniref:Murein biosynthesis integral membrane protein MurJ n=2 Tax=Cellulosimicrobium arenosum TaxID=2708133 RepID=A0A927J159_9MICO|nr:murein biosynthesis integral membrane protein MurJ [Cellulosimicrobium arenosum]MBD8079972.1 murein biosynthesis integral membrane protein MurJ [Cellulosimicrobium arenosum]
MASGTFVSRALGLVRNVLLVAAIGTTGLVADAFDIANKIPNVLFAILAGGVLNAVLVPQIVRAYRARNTQERLDKLLTLSGVTLLAISALLTAGASILVAIMSGPGWTSPQTALAVAFAFWCTPQLFFYGLYTLLGQVLNARGQFGPFMWAPALNNVVSIIGFGAFIAVYGPYAIGSTDDLAQWDAAKIALLAGTATLGVASQALILVVPLWRSGFRWHARLGVHGIGLRSAGQVALWTFAAVILEQVGVLFTTRFASEAPRAALAATFGAGAGDAAGQGVATGLVTAVPGAFTDTLTVAGNAAYTQALMIYLLPHSLVTVSIATALFTGMSAAAHAGDVARVRYDLSRGVRTVGVFTVLATAVLVVLALPITKLLVPTVTAASGQAVAQVLVAMAFGLVPLGGMVLMKWVYYAFEDGRTVFWIQVPGTVVLVGVSWLATRTLDPHWWVVGVAAAMSLSNIVAVALRTAGLRRTLRGLDGPRIVRMHVKAILAALASAGAGWGVLQVFAQVLGSIYGLSWWEAAVVVAVAGIVMVTVYVVLLRLLRVRELDELAAPIVGRARRLLRR